MATQIGINGFGRIGRSVFRILSERNDINVVCINDLFENEQLAYLLKYDTVMGIFQKEVRATENALYVDDQKIEMTEYRDPAAVQMRGLTKRSGWTGSLARPLPGWAAPRAVCR